MFLTLIISVVAIVTQMFISPYLESFSGTFNYINMFIYYLIISVVLNEKDRDDILRKMLIVLGGLAVYFIVVQGIYFDVRIYGNIGYANSYALLLLIGIYLNNIREKDNLTDTLEMIFILGIFFTGSRTTFILLLFYIVIKAISLTINKNRNIAKLFEGLIWGFLQYVIYSNIGIASIIVAPVILYIYYLIKKLKIKKYIYIVCLIFSAILMFIENSNTLERIRNISITNGSFQERLVFFEDSLKAIINNPLGNGINMFQYKLYDNASAFYDVKYIHNSILQTSYDIGVIGGVVFLSIIIYGLFIIYKGNKENKIFLLGAYISIFIHSLMDFDFAYSIFYILLVIIVVLGSDGEQINLEKVIKIIYILILIPAIYLAIFEFTLSVGKVAFINNNSNLAEEFYSIGRTLALQKDSRPTFNLGEAYKNLYDITGDEGYIENSLEMLGEAKNINPYNPMILWNMAYIYEKLGEVEETIEIRNKVIEKEKFYIEAYNVEYNYLKFLYDKTYDNKYKDMIKKLEESYNKNLKKINPKAKYMKNQLKENFQR